MPHPDYTLVVAVDRRHLDQLSQTFRTWAKYKPSILQHPLVVVYDRIQVTAGEVLKMIPHEDITCCPWAPNGVEYPVGIDKWTNQQRYKMLAGIVYGAAYCVKTPYWLKLDTDVVATKQDDWIDPLWFNDNPAIVAHPWGFTRPADQMIQLDQWVADNLDLLKDFHPTKPLNLAPEKDWQRVRHKRIISWCGFFSTDFTHKCADYAETTCGRGLLPVPSQDGFMWYTATRLGLPVIRTQMKDRGFEHWSTDYNVDMAVRNALTKPIL